MNRSNRCGYKGTFGLLGTQGLLCWVHGHTSIKGIVVDAWEGLTPKLAAPSGRPPASRRVGAESTEELPGNYAVGRDAISMIFTCAEGLISRYTWPTVQVMPLGKFGNV
jgi:hypothetical protein